MLHNGIPILQACASPRTRPATGCWREAIEKSAENIKAGDRWPSRWRRASTSRRDVVEMIAVGEESNSLEKVLVDIADGLEKRTSRQLDLFVRLLEPVMLLVMAVMTLLVVAGLLLPVFKMPHSAGIKSLQVFFVSTLFSCRHPTRGRETVLPAAVT